MKIVKYGIALLCVINLWGCSKGNSGAPAAIDPVTRKHQPGWLAAGTGGFHPAAYIANRISCFECHKKNMSDPIPPGQNGVGFGISKISCSGGGALNGIQCHATFPDPAGFAHVTGFDVPDVHGAKAKLPKEYGFVFCVNCHGADFKGNTGAGVPSCIACHLANATYTLPEGAPHSPAPWRGSPRTHVTTDPSNVSVCASCHTNGARTPLAHLDGVKDGVAHTPISAAVPAGCFNNTLCHGVVGHQNDPQLWTAPENHGARAKLNLGNCRDCHATGTNPPKFTVSKTKIPKGCETCHTQPGLAHPYIWLKDTSVNRTTTHATTTPAAINAYCIMCHGPNLNDPYPGIPSCFGPYPNNSPAGVAFKCHATNPTSNTNCTSCHGGPSGGPNGASFPNTANAHPKHTVLAGVSCFTCHNNAGSGTPQHASGAVVVSLLPSQAGAGATYNPTTKTCSNVSCHIGTTPPWNTTVSSGCATCHSTPLPGANGRHTKHWSALLNIQCDTCHINAANSGTHTTNAIIVGAPLSAKYNENGATASYNPVTGVCSNVVCHGGIVFRQNTQIFPAWNSTATFDRTQCSHCHNILGASGEPGQTPDTYNGPYIGPFSGYGGSSFQANNLHVAHLFIAAQTGTPPSQICHLCHLITGLPHYGNIVNGRGDLVPGFAAGTIKGSGIVSYTFTGGITPSGTCVTIPGQPGIGGCHFDAPAVRDWFNKSNP